jgi:hypothetical protein
MGRGREEMAFGGNIAQLILSCQNKEGGKKDEG